MKLNSVLSMSFIPRRPKPNKFTDFEEKSSKKEPKIIIVLRDEFVKQK